MKKRLFPAFLCVISTLIFFFTTPHAYAIEDPLSIPNNKFGIHILFDSELEDAAKLVNTKGGDWGYITIPLQAKDKDREKWQNFFDKARDLHLIPIIRLATENYYFNTQVWRKPTDDDIVDFANFLSSLTWPVKNRYIVVFNEVNRGDEWGGELNPEEYAQTLHFAVDTFKKASPDFFMISAGLDNAAPNQGTEYMNEYSFMRAVYDADPDVFNCIDGFSSHAYPNPAFSQPPSVHTTKSIASFTYERNLIKSFSNKELPVFITETGWTSDQITDDQRAAYYDAAMKSVWADKGIVAITPFLLKAGGQFGQFSFLKDDGKGSKQYDTIKDMPKIKGNPTFVAKEFTSEIRNAPPPQETRTYILGMNSSKNNNVEHITTASVLKSVFSWIFKL